MENLKKSETKFQKINRIIIAFWYLFAAALIIVYAAQKDAYHLTISLGTLAVPAGLALVWRISGLRRVHRMDFLILTFTFLAYPLGACLDFYRIVPGFDKVVHALSGTFVGLLCLALYYKLKPGHAIEESDAALAMAFVFFGSMAVAGLWEIGEYLLSAVVHIDLQRVLTTSISDTIWDMIVALIGAAALLPFVRRLCHGRRDVLTAAVDAFVRINLKE